MSFVALDIGTSFIKGAILDTRARAICHVRRVPFPAPVAGLPPAHVEIDPQAVTAAVDQLMGQLAPLADACQGVLLCGQMGGIVLVDAKGRPRTNYISWRDQRVLEPCNDGGTNAAGSTTWLDRVAALITPAQLAELGNELRPGSCTALLYWLTQCRPNVTSRAIPLSLPAFVAGHLTGTIPAEDPTIAIGGLDVRTGRWHHQAFAALGIDGFDWPEVDATRAPIGHVRFGGAQVPCFPAVGDHQCALLGVGLEADELSVNVSTGSQVSRLAPQSCPGPYQERHYFDGCLVQTITHLPAGRSLDALVALLTELPRAQGLTCPDPWSYIAENAVAASDDGMAVDLAFFAGPVGSAGSITGMQLENISVGHLFRAALRNMAGNYAHCANQLDPSRSWRWIAFSGGLANRLELLRSFVLADLPGPHRVCAEAEDTLLGLLALALVHAGQAESALAASAALQRDGAGTQSHQPVEETHR